MTFKLFAFFFSGLDVSTGFAGGPESKRRTAAAAAAGQKIEQLSADQAGRSADQPADAPSTNESSRKEKSHQSEKADRRRHHGGGPSSAAASAVGTKKYQRSRPHIRGGWD